MPQPDGPDAPARTEPRARVLCVDDNPQVLRLLQRQLGIRYELHTAATALDALKLMAEAGPFDVVVSDLRMPDMNGLAFLKRARELAPDTQRIILTGLPDPGTLSATRAAGGGEQLIVKPWTREDLVAAVDAAIARRG